jgi:hypothetical protein
MMADYHTINNLIDDIAKDLKKKGGNKRRDDEKETKRQS